MFPSLQRRPVCEFGIRAVRMQGSNTWRHFSGQGAANPGAVFQWLGRRMGLLMLRSWAAGGGGGGGGQAGCGKTKTQGLFSILANHCSFVTGQRLRRAFQIAELYSNLYSERSRRALVGNMWRRLQSKHAPSGKLVAALAGVFMWEEEKIKDDEMRRCAWELQALDSAKKQITATSSSRATGTATGNAETGWEVVMERKAFKVWRRPIEKSHMFEYRVYGSYTDVTPRQFFNVQLDTEYRKKWDSLVIKLEVVDRDFSTGSEVVHWATHFPYPMYSRDYVYVRRYDVDVASNLMILVSRAVQHPSVPEMQEFVRVHSYCSRMVIRPHKSFDENGFDYLLTYSDDPQTAFPRYCLSWMVSSGMPDFLEKLHTAALRARNMEVKIQDYVSISKPAQPQQPERHEEGSRPAGSGHIYA